MKIEALPDALWSEVRKAYVGSSCSCSQLAKRFGLNPASVSTRCKREGWRLQRLGGKQNQHLDQTPGQLGQAHDQNVDGMTKVATGSLEEKTELFVERVTCGTHSWLDEIGRARNNLPPGDIARLEKLSQSWTRIAEQGRKIFGLDNHGNERKYIVNIGVLRGDLKSAPKRANAQPIIDVPATNSGDDEPDVPYSDSPTEVPVPDCHGDEAKPPAQTVVDSTDS